VRSLEREDGYGTKLNTSAFIHISKNS
jgi:hypothetical protein